MTQVAVGLGAGPRQAGVAVPVVPLAGVELVVGSDPKGTHRPFEHVQLAVGALPVQVAGALLVVPAAVGITQIPF